MKNLIFTLCCVALLAGACTPSYADAAIYMRNSDGTITPMKGVEGQVVPTLGSAEDETNSVDRVEQQYSYKLTTADAQAKDAPGFVHTVTCATAAGSAATAGTVSIHDALTETTPTIATIGIPATAFVPFTVTLDAVATTGIYVGYATAAGISCTVSYR